MDWFGFGDTAALQPERLPAADGADITSEDLI